MQVTQCADRQIYRWMDRWTDGELDNEQMDGWMDGCMHGWMDGYMNGWMNGGIHEQMDKWMDNRWVGGWIDVSIDRLIRRQVVTQIDYGGFNDFESEWPSIKIHVRDPVNIQIRFVLTGSKVTKHDRCIPLCCAASQAYESLGIYAHRDESATTHHHWTTVLHWFRR